MFVSFRPFQHPIELVVMETKVSTLVIWLLCNTFIEGIRLSFVIVSTKLIWTLVNIIEMHKITTFCVKDKAHNTHTTYIAHIYIGNPLITVVHIQGEKHQPI